MENDRIKGLLRDDVSKRESRVSFNESPCDGCEEPIHKGDGFVFVGEGEKMCPNCIDEILSFLNVD